MHNSACDWVIGFKMVSYCPDCVPDYPHISVFFILLKGAELSTVKGLIFSTIAKIWGNYNQTVCFFINIFASRPEPFIRTKEVYE